ncbi:ATP-binding cassette domain-containing protein [Alteromonas sp. A079]|uniref:ATP-binding cassette domain-containing protein n=1 Tax=Alteromonas sp. A079 TaxID=3410268 RepID=UPI003BA16B36
MALKLDNVTIKQAEKTLLSINVTVNNGDVLCIMGPSGSGKSTLLNAIAGQLSAPFTLQGRIVLDECLITNTPSHLRGVGVVFQDALLFDHMTVGQNIIFAMPQGMSAKEKRRAMIDMLSAVELDGLENRAPNALSGGQQARVSLLRTLAAQPKVVLLDEPFSQLDTHLRAQIRTWTFEQLTLRDIPSILVTHDKDDAMAAGGKTIELSSC